MSKNHETTAAEVNARIARLFVDTVRRHGSVHIRPLDECFWAAFWYMQGAMAGLGIALLLGKALIWVAGLVWGWSWAA